MKTNIEKLDALTSARQSGWLEKAKNRQKNEAWLHVSFKIALKILRILRERNMTQKDLAVSLQVTPQYVNKILKGQENLSLDTILKLNHVLGTNLLTALAQFDTTIEGNTIRVGKITLNYNSYASAHIFSAKTEYKTETTIHTLYETLATYSPKCEQIAA